MLYYIFNATGSPVAYISKFATKIVIFGELWAMSVAVSAESVETQFVTERGTAYLQQPRSLRHIAV